MDWAGDRSLLDRHIAKPSEWISKKTFVRGLSQYSIVLVYIVHWNLGDKQATAQWARKGAALAKDIGVWEESQGPGRIAVVDVEI